MPYVASSFLNFSVFSYDGTTARVYGKKSGVQGYPGVYLPPG